MKGVPTLLVDTGNFLAEDVSAHGKLRPDAVVKDEWVLKAYNGFQVDVANLSIHDLPFFSELDRDQSRKNPILERVVSANVIAASADVFAPQPFTIRLVPDRRPGADGSKKIRVAFVGLSEQTGKAPPGLRVTDPIEAARRVVPMARGVADVVVVLAHLKSEDATLIAHEVPGIDVVIDGNGELFTQPLRLGQTSVVFTPHETRLLGELRFYRDDRGRFSIKDRYIALDSAIPDDPAAMALVNGAKDAIKEVLKRLSGEPIANPPTNAAGGPEASPASASNYVSAQACSRCHLAEYMQWLNTPHATALNSLAKKQSDADDGCLACHSTGFRKGGFRSISENRALANVQCEQCHGPGLEHVANPGKPYGRIADLPVVCSGCHTEETSANFNARSFWNRIKHK